MSWDEDRITATINRQYILSHLHPEDQERLDQPLRFGHGLTDDTYLDWILEKARRIFLILVDLELTDQIFGVIDDSWNDDDLPIPLDQVDQLRLTYERDEKVEKKFFQRQFHYLVRPIRKGDHVSYRDMELVPLELVEKRTLTQSRTDKVHPPGRPASLLLRKRIPLGPLPDRMPEDELLAGLETMRLIDHKHLQSLWASYTHLGDGYLLFSPVNDGSLKSFLTISPQNFKLLPKQDQYVLVFNWMHCLADGLSYLHGHGRSHRNIKPSTVLLDASYQVFLADSSIFSQTAMAGGERQGFDKETYDYAAPEVALRSSASSIQSASARRSSVPVSAMSVSTSPVEGSLHKTFSNPSNHPSHFVPGSRRHSKSNSNARSDPQKADVFSLGAIFLEILSFILKRTSKNFSSHRSARNKMPGRGGGLPDASFHKNLGQVESWMSILSKDASKKEDKIFRGTPFILDLVKRMMSLDPEERPTAKQVEERMYIILTDFCGMAKDENGKELLHCTQYAEEVEEVVLNFNELRLASQRAAAEACARVATTSAPLVNDNRELSFSATSTTDDEDWNMALPVEKVWQAPVYGGSYKLRT